MHKIRPKIIQVIYENRTLFLVTTFHYKQFFFFFFFFAKRWSVSSCINFILRDCIILRYWSYEPEPKPVTAAMQDRRVWSDPVIRPDLAVPVNLLP